jgi:hypothetical protein
MNSIFISYSHRDEPLKDEPETDFAALRCEGIIDILNDRELLAGDGIHSSISENLGYADIVLLLVS